MHFSRSGSGPVLVLLHGVGHHWQAWAPVLELLTSDDDTVAVDSPGFGRSPSLPLGVSPTVWAYADAFEAFFAAQGLERPHVAGDSMGRAVCLEPARRSAVRSATAFSPAGSWTDGERRYTQRSLRVLAGMPPRSPGCGPSSGTPTCAPSSRPRTASAASGSSSRTPACRT